MNTLMASPLDQPTTMEPFIHELHSKSIILIAIKWTGFTKNNHLGALPSVIIFIRIHNQYC